MGLLIQVLIFLLEVYFWILIALVMVSWLLAFNVINPRNPTVGRICDLLNRATRPVLARIRRVIPPLGGIDFSPLVVIFAIYILQGLLYKLFWTLQV